MLTATTNEQVAGVILFRFSLEGREYLVIRSSHVPAEIAPKKFVPEFWEFPKGRLEHGEWGIDGARREAEEEVGMIKMEFIPDFAQTFNYTTYRDGTPISKEVTMYLAQVHDADINLSREHGDYTWLFLDDALRRVTLPEMKGALRAAGAYLERI